MIPYLQAHVCTVYGILNRPNRPWPRALLHALRSLLSIFSHRSLSSDEDFEHLEDKIKLLVENYCYPAQEIRPRTKKRFFEEPVTEVVSSKLQHTSL